jgi:hypothetical protein
MNRHRFGLKLAVISVVVFAFSGCALVQRVAQPKAPPSALKSISARVQVDGVKNPRFIRAAFNDEMALSFDVIGGRLSGKASSPPIFVKSARKGSNIELDLAGARDETDALAKTFEAQDDSTLQVTPKETRFARIDTVATDGGGAQKLGLSGFLDPITKDYLVLAYFDRPATLRGRLKHRGANFHHAVDIPVQGFHWLRFRRTAAKRFVVTATPPSEVKFCLLLFPQGKPSNLKEATLDSRWASAASRVASVVR